MKVCEQVQRESTERRKHGLRGETWENGLRAMGSEGKISEDTETKMFREIGKELEGLDFLGAQGREVFKNESPML